MRLRSTAAPTSAAGEAPIRRFPHRVRRTLAAGVAIGLCVACGGPPPPSRSVCLVVGNGNVPAGTRPIVDGMPNPHLDPGTSCIESGRGARGEGVVTVRVDNPRVWTRHDLHDVRTSEGRRAQALTSTLEGWECAHCRLDLWMTGGDGKPNARNLPPAERAAINEEIVPWTVYEFRWGDGEPERVPLLVQGLRVGFTPVGAQLHVGGPRAGDDVNGAAFDVVLDPAVTLVPIQVVVLSAPGFPAGKAGLTNQLALWDRVVSATSQVNFLEGGELRSAVRALTPWVRGGEAGTDPLVSGWYLPDDIWIFCDIQFRLARYEELQVPNEVAYPIRGSGDVTSAFRNNVRPLLSSNPLLNGGAGLDQRLPMLVFMPRCSPSGSGGGFGAVGGFWLPGSSIVCISTGADFTTEAPAHELGHMLMQSHLHPDCTKPGFTDNLMCDAGGGRSLRPEQCSAAREKAATLRRYYGRAG